jgi:hypothetical protein
MMTMAHVRARLVGVVLVVAVAWASAAAADENAREWLESVTLAQSHGLPAATAWCAGAAAVLPPAQDPVLMRWPYVTNVVTGAAEVVFGVHGDLPRPAAARIDFWTEAAGERGAVAVPAEYTLRQWVGWPVPVNTTMHQYRARLRNVTTASEVCYRVVVDGVEVVGGLRFRTAPARGDASRPVRFVGYGDFGVASLAEGKVANALWARLEDVDFTAILGDDTYFNGKGMCARHAHRRTHTHRHTGTHRHKYIRNTDAVGWPGHEYNKRTFPYYASQWASKAVVPISGNHDYQYDDDDEPTQYLATFGLVQPEVAPEHAGRYYSFDWGHVHFSVLDTEWTGFDTQRKMNAWLRADLAAAQDQQWRVILYHKTPYVNSQIADNNVYRELLPIFEEGGVHMALGGHWHHYARYPPVRGDVPTPVTRTRIEHTQRLRCSAHIYIYICTRVLAHAHRRTQAPMHTEVVCVCVCVHRSPVAHRPRRTLTCPCPGRAGEPRGRAVCYLGWRRLRHERQGWRDGGARRWPCRACAQRRRAAPPRQHCGWLGGAPPRCVPVGAPLRPLVIWRLHRHPRDDQHQRHRRRHRHD